MFATGHHPQRPPVRSDEAHLGDAAVVLIFLLVLAFFGWAVLNVVQTVAEAMSQGNMTP